MKGVLAFALVASIGNGTALFAAEPLLESGLRHVQQIASAAPEPSSGAAASVDATAASPSTSHRGSPLYQAEGGGNLSKSGHSKATKTMMYAAIAAGFVVSAWQIDKHVLNITPSTLGQRKD